MERVEVIYQAAQRARAKVSPVPGSHLRADQIIEKLCEAIGIGLFQVSGDDPMLGGSAFARLDIADSEVPENGCVIWLRQDVPQEKQAFAVAHELGHFLLHRGEGVPLHLPCAEDAIDDQADVGALRIEDHRVEEYTPHARRELEANAFAAELLAPRAEIRRLFATHPQQSPTWLAAHFGITESLASERLVEAVFSAAAPQTRGTPHRVEKEASGARVTDLLAQLDPSQREAARANTPALVIAGPGTGKTATLVGRVAHLIAERGIQPERILALTFSNRAAGEMRERLMRHGLPGERMPVMTIHAFAATLLREYASQVPRRSGELKLPPDFRILDQSDAFLLMEELLAELHLFHYRSLSNPTAHVRTLLDDFSHARDKLLTPEGYLAQVEAMPGVPPQEAHSGDEGENDPQTESKQDGARPAPPAGTFTREQIARARERALAYGIWDRALRLRGLVDFGGLIAQAVELLRANAQVRAEVRSRYPKVVVDEFQDTNLAAAELLLLAAGNTQQELWVVGDRNQSIYRWRGASPTNLNRLTEHFPALQVFTLRRCYRSVPAIVQLGSGMAARMAEVSPGSRTPESAPAAPSSQHKSALELAFQPVPLEAHRSALPHPALLQSEFINATHEHLGLAAAIQQHQAAGFNYGDQAILCRTHRLAHRIAGALAAEGLPVRQLGDFFERQEIKDALALLELAAGPGPQGLLRGERLLLGMGETIPAREALATVVRTLAEQRAPVPLALGHPATLEGIPGLSGAMRHALAKLGEVAKALGRLPPGGAVAQSAIGKGLATFLLAPQGYAWHLVLVADGLVTIPPQAGAETNQPAAERQRADAALAALGELVRLAARFDQRWKKEPDFRTRLSQAVAHWQRSEKVGARNASGHHASPDTRDPLPGADVLDDDETSDPEPPLRPPTAPIAPPVRCFLHYLAALRAADTQVRVPAAVDDAVHVLTLHASKGLEFPVVYLPGLVQGGFPPTRNRREEAAPPGFREVEAPGAREAEERCLFYVGVTRARDVVAFTRATSDTRGKKHPSSLLELVEGALAGEPLHPLLSDEARATSAARSRTTSALEEEREVEDQEEGRSPGTEVTPTPKAAGKRTYTLRELEQYLECPRKYKYAYGYGLTDPAQHVVYRFHRSVRRGLGLLRQMQAVQPAPSWVDLERQFRSEWEAEGRSGHAYDAFYWEHARSILEHQWKKLTLTARGHETDTRQIAEPLQVELDHCRVHVTADQVTRGPSASNSTPAGSLATLSRLHTGRPHKRDAEDLRLPLYYLGYQQQHPDTPIRIELTYLGDTLAEASPDLALQSQGQVIDITKEAGKTAEDYRKPGRRKRSRLDKLDEAAAGIEAGSFAPKPDAQRCNACPYYYVCPADPEISS